MNAKQTFYYCLCIAIFVGAVGHATQGAMLTSFINQYSLQSSAQGMTGFAQSIGQSLSLVLLLWQAGRIAKSTIVVIAFTGVTVTFLAISLMPPFLVLSLIYCLFGIMFGAINSTTTALVADMFTGDSTPKYMSGLHGIFGLAGLFSPLFFMALFSAGFHWNIVIRITAAVVAALLVLYLALSGVSLKSIKMPVSGSLKLKREDFRRFFKRGSNYMLILSMFFYGMHQSAIVVWVIRYVSVFLGAPSLGAPSLSLYWAGATASRLFTHRVLTAPPLKILLFGNIAAAAVMCAGVLSGSAAVMALCVFVVGILNGTTIPVLLATGCADNDVNTILPASFINLALFLALAFCPLIVGAMVEHVSLSSGMFLSAACMLACGVLAYFYRGKKA